MTRLFTTAIPRRVTHLAFSCLCALSLVLHCLNPASAEVSPEPPTSAFDAIGVRAPRAIMQEQLPKSGFFANRFTGEVQDISEEQPKPAVVVEEAPAAPPTQQFDKTLNEGIGQAQLRDKILGRVDRTAPESFREMVFKYRTGDSDGARNEARNYVDYLTDLMFELRIYTKMIGEAFIEKNMIEDDEWVGVEQMLDWTFAHARGQSGSPLKLTHEAALKRIIPDPQHKVEIYFFFSLSSKYSREMAADVERLWRVVKNDKNVKMVALTLGPTPSNWIRSYREYTGLTLPIYNGEALAKQLRVGLVPAVVAVSPTLNKAYVKTGQQSFQRLYEFVRTTQGVPTTFSPELQRLATVPIGSGNKTGKNILVANQPAAVRTPAKQQNFKIERF